jgi:hypothetical protein
MTLLLAMFGRCLIHISAGTPTLLRFSAAFTQIFCGVSQSLQVSIGVVPRSLTSLPIHCQADISHSLMNET